MFSLDEIEGKKMSLKEEKKSQSKSKLISDIIGSQGWIVMGKKFNIGTFEEIYYMDWHDFVHQANMEYLSSLR